MKEPHLSMRDKDSSSFSSSSSVADVRPLAARVHARQEAWQRLYNLVAHLAHPKGDHRTNEEEDEAHDLIRELRTETSDVAARVHALIAQWLDPEFYRAEGALMDSFDCAKLLEAALAAARHVPEGLSPRDRARKCLTVLAHEGGATIRLSGLTLTDIHVDLEQLVADAIADAEAAALAAAQPQAVQECNTPQVQTSRTESCTTVWVQMPRPRLEDR